MLRYNIITEGNIISIEGSGYLADQQIVDFLHELTGDERIQPGARFFFDASAVNASEMSDQHEQLNIDLFTRYFERLANSRLAIFAPLDHQFDLAEDFIRRLSALPIHARHFADLSIACLWLGVPVLAI